MERTLIRVLVLWAALPLSAASPCALYEKPAPGVHCLHGNELDRTVTRAKVSWAVEFYSSWCGHCQHFAPILMEIGRDIESWSSVFRLGVLECMESKANQKACGKYKIEGYPTLRVSMSFECVSVCV